MKRLTDPHALYSSLKADHDLKAAAADLVSAYVANNHVPAEDLPSLIRQVHSCLAELDQPSSRIAIDVVPSRSEIQKSLGQDYIVSFLDGKPYKSLKRHLSANGLSPERYRARYGLPADYPMVSPNYSARRSQIARQIASGFKAA